MLYSNCDDDNNDDNDDYNHIIDDNDCNNLNNIDDNGNNVLFSYFANNSILGESRLDDVLKYKCLYDMKMRINSQKNAKISGIFGRSYIKTSKSWNAIKSTIVLPPLVYQEMFDYFIQNFENSLVLDENDSENIMNDASLVWAINFYDSLKQRQDKRKKEAQKRMALDDFIAKRDADLSDWEDSDNENYVPKIRHDSDNENENDENNINTNLAIKDDEENENLKSVN